MEYYSDQKLGKPEPISEDIPENAWRGIKIHIDALMMNGSFGESYPEWCPDQPIPCGTDQKSFWGACRAEIPNLPDDIENNKPSTLEILDLIQLCFKKINKPTVIKHHSYYGHNHFSYSHTGRKEGQKEFLEEINRIFERNKIVFRLQYDGQITRILSPEMVHSLENFPKENELDLDQLLAQAKNKIYNPDPQIRKEGLDRLWDAWERLKTLDGKDKKESISLLLDKASSTNTKFKELLDKEAKELTYIGNNFQIRHYEKDKATISDPKHIDYLFFRMLSMISLLLKARSKEP